MPISDQDERWLTKKEKLLNYIANPDELNNDPEFADLFEKYEFIYSLIKTNSRPNAARILMKKFDLGRSMAYQYIKETEDFFGKASGVNTEFLRNLAIEQIQMDIQLARARGDFKSVSALWKSLADWAGIKDSKDSVDPEKLEVNQFYVTLKSGNVPLDSPQKIEYNMKKELLHSIHAEEISFEEIMTPYEERNANTE